MNPTIKDVAKLAKTSKSTVSRYLNGHKVRRETEEALKKVIKELNYFPNINARRLVMNNTRVIGIVVDDIANNFYSGIFKGIEDMFNANGYQCVYYSRTSHYQGEFGFVDLARERQVDGLIIVSFLKRSQKFIEKIQKLSIPVALIGDSNQNEQVFSIDVNNEHGIREIIKYLHRIGHRKIAYITGPEEFSATHWREKGYKDTIKELGLSYDSSWIVPSDWTEAGGYSAMMKLLEFDGITAVIGSNDEVAIGALLSAREMGYKVPMDYSIVGFDDIAVARWVYPPLTSVKQPLYEIGEKVAEELVNQLKHGKAPTEKRILTEPQLVVRQSCINL